MGAETRHKVKVTSKTVNGEEYVNVQYLPDMKDLRAQVENIVKSSSWYERYGIAWLEIAFAFLVHLVGLRLLGAGSVISFFVGCSVLSVCHSVLANRAGHLATHNALCDSRGANRVWSWLFVEVIGCFSLAAARRTHIREHHPFTNVIGIGDSSSWKVPKLPGFVYMFFAPLLLPLATPFVSLQLLATTGDENRKQRAAAMAAYCASAILGLVFSVSLVHLVAGLSPATSFPAVLASRALFGVPYIHINIFQHIGLPMYSPTNAPRTLYQMSTGVLNLKRNFVLDWAMGHCLISCHVEHHLFPSLSDNMCLKIKPAVRAYISGCGLPYHEAPYCERLLHFVRKYKELMVRAPPITHFIGLQ